MSKSAHKSYRPLTSVAKIYILTINPLLILLLFLGSILAFRLDFLRSSRRLDAAAFHATNIALHALASALVVRCRFPDRRNLPVTRQSRFHFCRLPALKLCARVSEQRVLREDRATDPAFMQVFVSHRWFFGPEARPGPAGRSQGPAWAGVAGALFAAHPVHTEAVAGVVGRAGNLPVPSALPFPLTHCDSTSLPIPQSIPPASPILFISFPSSPPPRSSPSWIISND
jgi:hypothetical protein